MKKITLYVVRLSYNGIIHDSAPCSDCHKTLSQLGIKRVVYSNEQGDFTSCKMSEYIPKSLSLGRRFIESDFKLGRIEKKSKQDETFDKTRNPKPETKT